MASPHTAGLLAYLLSLYGTEGFNPALDPEFMSLVAPGSSGASLYDIVHSVLPSWAAAFLPPPRMVNLFEGVETTGPATITPKQLKNALLSLATKNALTDALPKGTPNLLIFNNATAA